MATLQHPTTRQTVSVPDATVDDYLERGWLRPGDAAASTLPTADWTNDQIRAYADTHGIDLTGARVKADMLDAITAATAVVDSP